MDFGSKPLRVPLLVETIETAFVPVLVYNNREADAALLKRFSEPSWNNPVMRFLNAEAQDVVPRRDRVWSTAQVTERLVTALDGADRPVPPSLRALAAELSPDAQRLTFAMHCFWVGERVLSRVDGVLATRAGWHDGHEVVEVTFDASKVDVATLCTEALTLECARRVYAHEDAQLVDAKLAIGNELVTRITGRARDAKSSDRHHDLEGLDRVLPLTAGQRTSLLAAQEGGLTDEERDAVLSPRQRALRTSLMSLSDDARRQLPEAPADLHALADHQRVLERAAGLANDR